MKRITSNTLRIGTLSVIFLLFMTVTFFAGRASSSPAPAPAYQESNLQAAQAGHMAYYISARRPKDPIHAFSVNLDQYQAMGSLLSENPEIAGFRLYYGLDGGNSPVMYVMGVSGLGSDLTGKIFSTSQANSGICPVICDAASPMMITE